VKAEVERRKARFEVMARNKETIERKYLPLHGQLFDKCSDLGVKKVGEKKKISDDIFTFPLFDEKLCDMLVEELNHFKDSELAHSRPNSMNRQGVILEEVGLGKVVDAVRDSVEGLARQIYPDLVGSSGLDSAKAFTVEYDAEEEAKDKELSTHFDNAEVTINVSLTSGHSEGELYFLEGEGGKVRGVEHRKGWAVLHRGEALHGAFPVTEGSRANLIIWFRSSAVRNQRCPMCGEAPQLKEVTNWIGGDGFTLSKPT